MNAPTRQAVVVTVSDRSAAGLREDVSGPLAAELLAGGGWRADVRVVPDEVAEIVAAVREAADAGARLVVTTGGTGVSPRDVTPDAMDELFDRELPGIAEELRRRGAAVLPQALLSRGRAGIAGRALVVNLPGSPGAVRDGIPVVLSVAAHALSQLDGGDHP
ncbi:MULTISPECIES: MogA/MoaB family molybdenum cofactor biosynthesis protein [Microbacterium]|uniref:MogA/MoaB family molybdenum cofactor biosynthesis protein n=1 Tax=Microbacterium TaxID=33882 RepID=UPI00217D9662|nr:MULTISPECIES: MogA/MoaB family molybdenum cofactor biosynthesis protein [Microbacterium]UWF76996.1 MogA/MoaB family molybdenum cofactor biosynthesis protein [Microbacterium neungamense]WCM55156.1 MogA/MoaB family molybdenum cofactor biosynthesis protein [Microbacterium sp. EF45047]